MGDKDLTTNSGANKRYTPVSGPHNVSMLLGGGTLTRQLTLDPKEFFFLPITTTVIFVPSVMLLVFFTL